MNKENKSFYIFFIIILMIAGVLTTLIVIYDNHLLKENSKKYSKLGIDSPYTPDKIQCAETCISQGSSYLLFKGNGLWKDDCYCQSGKIYGN